MRPLWSSGKTLAANAGGRGFEPTKGTKCFSHFTLLKWNVKNCFVKLNIKLSLLRLLFISHLKRLKTAVRRIITYEALYIPVHDKPQLKLIFGK